VPDAWIGMIPFGSTTPTWPTRYSTYPSYYQGTVAVRMWVDTAARMCRRCAAGRSS
jgi:hypothetical protein